MPLPETKQEALARGFQPLKSAAAVVDRLKAATTQHDHIHSLMLGAAPIDCNDPANEGKRCSAIPDGQGNVVICFCTSGACSPDHALIGPES